MSVLNSVLTAIVKEGASDIHLRTGSAPAGRVNGVIRRYGDTRLAPEHVEAFTREMMSPAMWDAFTEKREADFAYGIPNLARFRVNAYYQRGTIGLIMRVIEDKAIPTFAQLGLPIDTFEALAQHERGLVLVTGPTGSGKTTTLASLLNHINATQPVNIVTLEDPIEVLHRDQMAMISQRELGMDTMSFANGLRASMRQDPDVILIGEMRDKETVEAALSAAQTGHLVFSTLHTQDAIRTVNRIIDFFAPHERDQIRQGLSESIVGIVSQRLLPKATGGRVLGLEILLGTPTVRECIKDPERTEEIKQALQEGGSRGMHTFDQHLASLVASGLMTEEDAMASATSPHELKIMMMRAQYA
ncbi:MULTISPECIES: PilT/PilU family type 4a pilus ATPase [unclassified Deinococcus]|jgi:twitching motility protein PilT|uniref:PilT/PilU family type 4a pilus ATPase n=1 Tax=unclassified Deinococcus TaxID=2623546 RepID=UPI000C181BB0|nr:MULTISPECIES: PilT/PilU family type 4a pilus ATPase [unclassified Deinococcus]MBX8467342.1 PilT/PilU family type 4a pilus ATPase [Deinococcus sp. RIT780]MCD0156782.1 PilT/PilU family type 4a pilus ATPase [Deinococcus sp. 6GRE01]MCD0161288.1 PilT/PilU family type 4a pilus ATPase [Deinococcus sp. 6YEL10]MCD0164961.1 PilT/PilU family type 4a pilus ATPase [Deinococcus sp. 12RED42]MCD0175081.1 PilT/PilU family type 4a pilus ATPase [Deinococcus sp. 14RED07]